MERYRVFLSYVIPSVLAFALSGIYAIVDGFFVGNSVGDIGLSSINVAYPVVSLIQSLGTGIGMGGAVLYSIRLAMGEKENADAMMQATMQLLLLAGIFVTMLVLLFLTPILQSLGAEGELLLLGKDYLRIIVIGAVFQIFGTGLLPLIRNTGGATFAMATMMCGFVSNILLDYLFIFPLQMGIFGAVLATGLAPGISMLILLPHRLKKNNHFYLIKTTPHVKITQTIFSLGFPSLVTEVSSGIVILVFNTIILKLQGNIGVAAYGVIANLSLVVSAMYTGIAQGIQPLISRAYGCGDIKNSKLILRYAMTTMLVLSCAVYLLVFFFANPITSIFNSEHNLQLQEIAPFGLKLYFTAVGFVGFNIIISVFFTSSEKPIPAHFISLLRGLLLIIPMAFLLSALWGITGVWLAFPVTEFVVAVFGAGMYGAFQKK